MAKAGLSEGLKNTHTRTDFENLRPGRLYSWGNYFGEMEILLPRARLASVRCEYSGLLLVLKKEFLLQLTQEFSEFANLWRAAAYRRMKHWIYPKIDLQAVETHRDLAAIIIQRGWRKIIPTSQSQLLCQSKKTLAGNQISNRPPEASSIDVRLQRIECILAQLLQGNQAIQAIQSTNELVPCAGSPQILMSRF